jgi:hypothetical protein
MLAAIKSTFSLVFFFVFLGLLVAWYIQVAVQAKSRGEDAWAAAKKVAFSRITLIGATFAATSLIRAFVGR